MDATESEAISARNQKSPTAMAMWWGLMRRRRTVGKVVRRPPTGGTPYLVAVRLGVGLAQALGHRRQELVGQGRHLVDDARELALAEDENLHVVLGHDRRRPWTAVEQRQLAEVLAPAELGDLLLPAFHRRVAVEDQEELVAGLALLHEHLAGRHLHVVGGAGDGLQFFLRARREERHLPQVLEVLVFPPHRHGRDTTCGP